MVLLKVAVQKSRLMRVIAPVGVLLPSGLGLKIDQADVGRAGFVRCLPNGCVAEVVMDDNLVKQLRSGQTATFIIFQTPEEGIGFPMSLKGFGEGYDKAAVRGPAPWPGFSGPHSTRGERAYLWLDRANADPSMTSATVSLLDRAGINRQAARRHLDRGLEGADDGELYLEYAQSEMLVFDNGRLK